MITHVWFIGHPSDVQLRRSGERDQVCELVAPDVLDPVWQQQHPLGR